MPDRLERLAKLAYKKWKSAQPARQEPHPDEETLACFLENRLAGGESQRLKEHLIRCGHCQEIIVTQIKAQPAETAAVPNELLAWARDLVKPQDSASILEVLLRIKEKALEILGTTGDVLVGQELVPAPILRSRKIKDFKDEVTILKDFKDIRIEAKIVNKAGKAFNLTIMAKQKATQRVIKDLRVTLLKDDLELESYHTDSGSVTFEHVLLGKYKVELSTLESKIASVLLEINV